MALTKISTGMLKQDAASSDLNIDAGTLYLDVSNNRVGIANTSPSAPLTVQSDSGASAIHLVGRASDGYSLLAFRNNADNTTLAALFADESSDDLQIHVAGSERMRISSGGKVGIGTSSPSQTLHVNSGNNNDVALFESSDSVAKITFKDNTSSSAINTNNGNMLLNCDLNDEVADSFMAFRVDNDEKMRIEDNGRVGIGTNSPEELLHLTDTGGNAVLKFTRNDTTITSGNTIGAIHFAHKDADDAGVAASIVGKATSAFGKVALTFATGNPTTKTERMRLDADGNLMVGTTDRLVADGTDTGLVLGGQSDLLHVSRSGGDCAKFNRVSNNGSIVTFAKDGDPVGSIGTVSGSLYIASPVSGDSGLRFSGATVHPCTTDGAPRDNEIDLGYLQGRFDDIYATNGTIQTSDRNEKQDIEALSDAEQRVAVAAKGLLRKFRWKDSVADKGDEARIHFGIIAQDLQDAFTAEGLDAGRYAMFINSTWTDEETGEERSRMGVRYSELLAFIIAAI